MRLTSAEDLKKCALVLPSAMAIACTCAAVAAPPDGWQITVPSGRHVKVLSISPAKNSGGKQALMMRYLSNRSPGDKAGLEKEADDVWDLFVLDADRSGLNTAIMMALVSQPSLPAAAPGKGGPQIQCTSFLLEKNAQGLWCCRNNDVVGKGNPAKAACKQGYQLFAQGRLQDALACYNKTIALDANYAQAYVDRGGLYLVLNQIEKSLSDSNRALSLVPGSPAAFCNRGIAGSRMNDPKKAIEDYSRAIRLDPKMALPYVRRAADFFRLGEYEKAVADLNRAIVLQPAAGELYHERAVALEKLADGDRQKARELGYYGEENIVTTSAPGEKKQMR